MADLPHCTGDTCLSAGRAGKKGKRSEGNVKGKSGKGKGKWKGEEGERHNGRGLERHEGKGKAKGVKHCTRLRYASTKRVREGLYVCI